MKIYLILLLLLIPAAYAECSRGESFIDSSEIQCCEGYMLSIFPVAVRDQTLCSYDSCDARCIKPEEGCRTGLIDSGESECCMGFVKKEISPVHLWETMMCRADSGVCDAECTIFSGEEKNDYDPLTLFESLILFSALWIAVAGGITYAKAWNSTEGGLISRWWKTEWDCFFALIGVKEMKEAGKWIIQFRIAFILFIVLILIEIFTGI